MHTLLAAAALCMFTLSAAAQPKPSPPEVWKPASGHIMTRWAADVTTDNAWPEYPRPQLVRDQWQNLNGLWKYRIDNGPTVTSGQLLVPFPIESALSGVGRPLQPHETLTCTRTFTVPEAWSGQKILLHFGAVDWKAAATVNDQAVGEHTGGYDPFTFDITDALKPGPNTLSVVITDPTDSGGQPRGKQQLTPEGIWYTRTSGIWQTVWLEPVPSVAITNVAADADISTGVIRFVVEHTYAAGQSHEATVEVFDGGKSIATKKASTLAPIPIKVPSAKPWSPDSPTLYDVKVTMDTGDSVRTYCAFRDIKVSKDAGGVGVNRLMLNGKPLFQFGPLDQGFWPDGLYTPPTDEAMKEDILAVKKMGGNMLRKHVKVEPDRFYYWCDKLGIMVWQDMPSIFIPKQASPDGIDWKANFEDELHRMILTHKNHPSIIMWVPFNEGWGQHDTQDIVAKVKEWDPTRLVNNASGWTDMHVGDVTDLHAYPGPGMNPAEPARASVLGEFGGLGLPIENHTWVNNKNNWGYVTFKDQKELTDAYVALIDRLPALIAQGLCAAVYTQTTDVEIECNGWMTYDRAIWKIDPARAAAATAKLYGPAPIITTILPTAQHGPQTWRYTLDKPADTWFSATFDDASWTSGPTGFGSTGTPGAIIGTQWKTDDIWLRRPFDLTSTDYKNPHLQIYHDEDAEVYINGTLAATFKGYTTGYILEPLSPQARALLKKGHNTIAVHCHQTTGGQNIDVGLVEVSPASPTPTK